MAGRPYWGGLGRVGLAMVRGARKSSRNIGEPRVATLRSATWTLRRAVRGVGLLYRAGARSTLVIRGAVDAVDAVDVPICLYVALVGGLLTIRCRRLYRSCIDDLVLCRLWRRRRSFAGFICKPCQLLVPALLDDTRSISCLWQTPATSS